MKPYQFNNVKLAIRLPSCFNGNKLVKYVQCVIMLNCSKLIAIQLLPMHSDFSYKVKFLNGYHSIGSLYRILHGKTKGENGAIIFM